IVVIVCMIAPPNRGSPISPRVRGTRVPAGGAVHSIRSGLRSPLQALVDLLTKKAEIDWLGKQPRGPKLGRSLSGRFVPIGSNHDYRDVRTFRLHLGKHFKAGHTWHVYV